MVQARRKEWILAILLACAFSALILWSGMSLTRENACPCNGTRAMNDIFGLHWHPINTSKINVIYQIPLDVLPDDPRWPVRQAEYIRAVSETLEHPDVSSVHLLTEQVLDQVRLYAMLPSAYHHKIRTFNLNKRMAYADAVRYANRFLAGCITVMANADIVLVGPEWGWLSVKHMQDKFYGLARHEAPLCATGCDCSTNWEGCHDSFVFVPPLLGGDPFLEAISYRMGGIWGGENRFLWEVKNYNDKLDMTNPCLTLVTRHWHCMEKGLYRPDQDNRRVNLRRSIVLPPRHIEV